MNMSLMCAISFISSPSNPISSIRITPMTWCQRRLKGSPFTYWSSCAGSPGLGEGFLSSNQAFPSAVQVVLPPTESIRVAINGILSSRRPRTFQAAFGSRDSRWSTPDFQLTPIGRGSSNSKGASSESSMSMILNIREIASACLEDASKVNAVFTAGGSSVGVENIGLHIKFIKIKIRTVFIFPFGARWSFKDPARAFDFTK